MNAVPAPVVVCAAYPALREAAQAVAAALALPYVEATDDVAHGALALVLDADGWSLRDPAPGPGGGSRPVRCDLLAGTLGERLQRGASGEGRLARALGLRRHAAPRVLDATAGLGRDSVLAAALGCTVIACERSPVVALLLRDGLERGAADPALAAMLARIRLEVGDARDVLPALHAAARPDVVLIDPMFPARRKTARAKHEMQLLQRLLGPDDDAAALLAVALAYARRRVVVKRPAHGPPVSGAPDPDLVIAGRGARYDVYLVTHDDGVEAGVTPIV